MRSEVLLVCALAGVAVAQLPDLGYGPLNCDAQVMKKSLTTPSNANSVRFADIAYIAAMGDSLTAANGAGANRNDPVGVLIQYRGLTFSVGGDRNLSTHVSLANVLKEFNPNLFGYSVGTGSSDDWTHSYLNAAVPGAIAADLPAQADDIIRRMTEHPNIDFKSKWKLIHIFIGGNDMCAYCKHPDTEAPNVFANDIATAVSKLKAALPKTIVVLAGMFDLKMLRQIDHDQYFCDGLHTFECPCESDKQFTDQEIHDACHAYMDAQQQLEDSGQFDDTDDFTFVIQPFFNDLEDPPRHEDGTINLDFFAADCFHFSQLGHAMVAKNLWNNLVQPVGSKNTVAELNNLTMALQCPDTKCPFVRTVKNSQNCVKYQTPVHP